MAKFEPNLVPLWPRKPRFHACEIKTEPGRGRQRWKRNTSWTKNTLNEITSNLSSLISGVYQQPFQVEKASVVRVHKDISSAGANNELQ